MEFLKDKHAAFIVKVGNDKDSIEYSISEYLRMSGIYWGISALSVINELDKMNKEEIIEFVLKCENEDGGFGSSVGFDSHILYTLSAVQILAIFDSLDKIDREKTINYILSLENEDGSFKGDKWGEVDTRFSYTAVNTLSILGGLSKLHNREKTVEFVIKCQNFDGGFGCTPGTESHGGQIFCCIGFLSIMQELDRIKDKIEDLGWWLSERQCDSGGLNGRPEKQADVCYSWWIVSVLSIIGKLKWIDNDLLVKFILNAQDKVHGGIADRSDDVSDIFHTFFGLCGLALTGYLEKNKIGYNQIDPTYALPVYVVDKLKLQKQTL